MSGVCGAPKNMLPLLGCPIHNLVCFWLSEAGGLTAKRRGALLPLASAWPFSLIASASLVYHLSLLAKVRGLMWLVSVSLCRAPMPHLALMGACKRTRHRVPLSGDCLSGPHYM